MRNKRLIVAVVGALFVLSSPVVMGAVIDTRVSESIAIGADPLLALESNRSGIVERLVAEHRRALHANGIDETAFRTALWSLRVDQLLAASLVHSLQEVSAIVAASPDESGALARYVAVVPTNTLAALPAADAYLVRDGESLAVVKAAQLQLNAHTQLVGYFVAAAGTTVVAVGGGTGITPKDGSGSGANSWIGYTAGSNLANGPGSAVAAGSFNLASGQNAFVGAGQSNVASGISSLVIGGFDNRAVAIDSLVGAGAGNRATGARSVVVGGGYNLASGQWSFIGGGGRQSGAGVAGASAQDHIAAGDFSTIGGGQGNRAGGGFSTIGGGIGNAASGFFSTVAAGYSNVAGGDYSTIGGGNANTTAGGVYATVAGGNDNVASGTYSTIGGGNSNTASGFYSTVPGGAANIASGAGSVAMGRNALTQTLTPTPHSGAFIFSDGMSGNFRSTDNNTFSVLATGGVMLATAATNAGGEATVSKGLLLDSTGMLKCGAGSVSNYGPCLGVDADNDRIIGNQNATMYFRTSINFAWFQSGIHSNTALDPGAGGTVLATLRSSAVATTVTGIFRAQVVTATSDRNAKTDFAPLNARTILAKVVQMPIATWSYKNEAGDGIRHIGPVAQDFRQLFNVGYDDKSIATVDADGVALAAIKGLYEEVQERDARIALQQVQLDTQAAKLLSQQLQLESQSAGISSQQWRIAALEQQLGELAVSQLQLHDMAAIVLKLQQEMASLRHAREVAVALK